MAMAMEEENSETERQQERQRKKARENRKQRKRERKSLMIVLTAQISSLDQQMISELEDDQWVGEDDQQAERERERGGSADDQQIIEGDQWVHDQHVRER